MLLAKRCGSERRERIREKEDPGGDIPAAAGVRERMTVMPIIRDSSGNGAPHQELARDIPFDWVSDDTSRHRMPQTLGSDAGLRRTEIVRAEDLGLTVLEVQRLYPCATAYVGLDAKPCWRLVELEGAQS
jgi:hypothetical protein